MPWFELLSPYPPEKCVDRLQDGMTPGDRLEVLAAHRWVQLSKRLSHRNSFRPYLRATFTDCGAGSRVWVRLGFHPFVLAFMALWVGFSAFMGVMAVALRPRFPEVLLPVAFGLYCPLLGWFFRLLCHKDERLLIDFVTTTLEAKVRWRWP